MTCNKCLKDNDLAKIPYIEHEKRMFKAYQREVKLKYFLLGSNILWGLIVVLLLFAR